MKLGLVANYQHTGTIPIFHEPTNDTPISVISTTNDVNSSSQLSPMAQSFRNHPSFNSPLTNYTNFMNNDYKPFIYQHVSAFVDFSNNNNNNNSQSNNDKIKATTAKTSTTNNNDSSKDSASTVEEPNNKKTNPLDEVAASISQQNSIKNETTETVKPSPSSLTKNNINTNESTESSKVESEKKTSEDLTETNKITETTENNNSDKPIAEVKADEKKEEQTPLNILTQQNSQQPQITNYWPKQPNNYFRLNDRQGMMTKNGRYNNRLSNNRNSRIYDSQRQIYKVKLTFAEKDFEGEGSTLQLAKHNAANKALEHFSSPENFLKAKTFAESSQNKTVKAYRPPQFYNNQQAGL